MALAMRSIGCSGARDAVMQCNYVRAVESNSCAVLYDVDEQAWSLPSVLVR